MNDKPIYKMSAFQVEKPEIPERWLSGSIFSHGSHEEVRCQSCHRQSAQSEKTSDVLLPDLKNCLNCHTEPRHSKGVRSECITCHGYHDSMELDSNRKREISELLSRLN